MVILGGLSLCSLEVPNQDSAWRRTADGWKRIDNLSPSESRFSLRPLADLHPVFVAIAQFALALAGLYCCCPRHSDRPGRDRYVKSDIKPGPPESGSSDRPRAAKR